MCVYVCIFNNSFFIQCRTQHVCFCQFFFFFAGITDICVCVCVCMWASASLLLLFFFAVFFISYILVFCGWKRVAPLCSSPPTTLNSTPNPSPFYYKHFPSSVVINCVFVCVFLFVFYIHIRGKHPQFPGRFINFPALFLLLLLLLLLVHRAYTIIHILEDLLGVKLLQLFIHFVPFIRLFSLISPSYYLSSFFLHVESPTLSCYRFLLPYSFALHGHTHTHAQSHIFSIDATICKGELFYIFLHFLLFLS